MDKMEVLQRHAAFIINSQIESLNPDQERERLEKIYNKVWNTVEVNQDFEILAFMAPFVVVRSRKTGEKDILGFQDTPRFYFNKAT